MLHLLHTKGAFLGEAYVVEQLGSHQYWRYCLIINRVKHSTRYTEKQPHGGMVAH